MASRENFLSIHFFIFHLLYSPHTPLWVLLEQIISNTYCSSSTGWDRLILTHSLRLFSVWPFPHTNFLSKPWTPSLPLAPAHQCNTSLWKLPLYQRGRCPGWRLCLAEVKPGLLIRVLLFCHAETPSYNTLPCSYLPLSQSCVLYVHVLSLCFPAISPLSLCSISGQCRARLEPTVACGWSQYINNKIGIRGRMMLVTVCHSQVWTHTWPRCTRAQNTKEEMPGKGWGAGLTHRKHIFTTTWWIMKREPTAITNSRGRINKSISPALPFWNIHLEETNILAQVNQLKKVGKTGRIHWHSKLFFLMPG